MSETITHEVELDGQPAYSTQLPKGMDPDEYDRLIRNLNESVRTEASAGRQGAEDRLELAVRLKMCPGLEKKSWKQLVQEDAYTDAVSYINAKYSKSKSAYSNHLTELRESKDQLRQFFVDRFQGLVGPDGREDLVDEWYLDPNREKNGGGPKKIPPVTSLPVEVTDSSDTDEEEDDAVPNSLKGICAATTGRLQAASVSDWEGDPDFLNGINGLIRAAERVKAMYIQHMRSGI